jgi:hypothetical protein
MWVPAQAQMLLNLLNLSLMLTGIAMFFGGGEGGGRGTSNHNGHP